MHEADGYMGKLVRVNLTERNTIQENISLEDKRKYLGGRGLGAKLLFEELKPGIHPLSSQNKLLFFTGPITGTPLAGSSRFIAMAKSPLTNIWGEATAGGFWGPELKKAGFDGIIIEGKAEKPTYLWVHDGEIEFKSAEPFWGFTITETIRGIKETLKDPNIRVLAIGPSGERMVKISCIANDGFGVLGRTGLGAVMGSKRLKAIAVRGKGAVKISDSEKVKKLNKEFLAKLKQEVFVQTLRKFGSGGSVSEFSKLGTLPTRNFSQTTFDYAEKIDPSHLKLEMRSRGCLRCPIACKKEIKWQGKWYRAPEYETIAAFGSNCLNHDYWSLIKINELCNEYGIDTISAGVIVSFVLECFERGLLTQKDTDGINIQWGNSQAILRLVEKIAKKEGIGEVLSQGVKAASEEIGGASKLYAMHVKGLEIPMHPPRAKKGLGFNYGVSFKGACHNQCAHDPVFTVKNSLPELGIIEKMNPYQTKGKAKAVKLTQDVVGVIQSMVICNYTVPFGVIPLSDIVNLVHAVTGWEISLKELLYIGERANNLCRAFSIREGISAKDDTLPERFAEPLKEGPAKGERFSREDFERMRSEYYKIRGWDKNGIPTGEKLKQLGLDYVAEGLRTGGWIKGEKK